MNDRPVAILLLEDNPGDALLLEEYLLDCSLAYSLRVVDRVGTAVELLQHESFDILLMDLNLPDAAGSEIPRSVRSVAPHVPIVILSGSLRGQTDMMVRELGVDGFLRKGAFTNEELCAVISSTVKKE